MSSAGLLLSRELVLLGREDRLHWWRTSFALTVGIVILHLWEEAAGRRATLPPGQIADLSGRVFGTVVVFQYLAIYLLTPALVATGLARDRSSGLLEQLNAAGVEGCGIILGKVGSRWLLMVLVLLACLPILALLPLLGGVEPGAVWRSQAGALAALAFVASVSIWHAADSRTTMAAFFRSYATCTLLAGTSWFASCHAPLSWVTAALLPVSSRQWSWESGTWSAWGLVIPVTFSAIALSAAVRRLDSRRELEKWEGAPSATSRAKGAMFLAAVALALFLAQVAAIMFSLRIECLHALLWLGLLLVAILAAVHNPIVDRQRGFLELVLLTPMRPREIVRLTESLGWHALAPLYVPAAALSIAMEIAGWTSGLLLWPAMVPFGAILWMVGTMLSFGAIAAPRAGTSPLAWTFVYVALVSIGYPLATSLVSAPLLLAYEWIGIDRLFWLPVPPAVFVALWGMCWWRWRTRQTARAAIAYCAGVQLLVVAFSCLIFTQRIESISAASPAFWFHSHFGLSPVDRAALRWGLFTGLVVYFFWVRWFAIAYFDDLVGRVDGSRDDYRSIAASKPTGPRENDGRVAVRTTDGTDDTDRKGQK